MGLGHQQPNQPAHHDSALCRSADNDIGAQLVPAGKEMRWDFGMMWFGATHFWCRVAVQDKRLSFIAYDQNRDRIYSDCVYGMVMDDGVHLKYNDTFGRIWEFEHTSWDS
ncbi:Self-incompatibility protein S1 [Linum grandiflorum]